jgi:hypothetical protein
MLPVGFERTISADERPKTYALDRAATGTGTVQRVVKPNAVIYEEHTVIFWVSIVLGPKRQQTSTKQYGVTKHKNGIL